MATLTLRPSAAGDATNLTPNGEASNYLCVDEVSSDGDGTYLSGNANYDLFNLADHTTEEGIINSVTVYVRSRTTYLYDDQVYVKLKSTNVYSGTPQTTTESYADYTQLYTVNPYTSAAWTWAQIDALQVGVHHIGTYGYNRTTQIWVVVNYTALPTVTTQSCTSVTDVSATGNGNITDTGGENATRRGFCYKQGTTGDPTTSDSVVYDDGSFGTGAYTKAITGLSADTSYRVRAYAVNPAGTAYGTTVDLRTTPSPPTGVLATKGEHTDKVVVTWTKSSGATGYHVYQDDVDVSGLLGDVATYDDTDADASVITPGNAAASRGKYKSYIELSITGLSVAEGTTHEYYVTAVGSGGESPVSGSDYGYRSHGTLTYQWQRSAADSDASYSNISGAIYTPYNDTGAPAYGSGGRYYKCVLDAAGAAQQTTAAARGYRKSSKLPSGKVGIVIKDTSGNTLYYLKNFTAPSTDYRVNKLAAFSFRVSADDPAREYLVYPNEAWLYIDGVLQDVFKITVSRRAR